MSFPQPMSVLGRSGSWVLVAGGFHRDGGMDGLNWALARYLVDQGEAVHLVCHRAEPELAHDCATVHRIPRPGRSFLLGTLLLGRQGRKIATGLAGVSPGMRVVVNGGNCDWPDVNWVHCVHHAWAPAHDSSPAWFKLKNRASHRLACVRERRGLRSARIVIANSDRTRRELIKHLGVDPERIYTIYPGARHDVSPPSWERRAASRAWLEKDDRKPLVAFAGALGHDCNKGFDILFRAWRQLCAMREWDADLIVAGGGRALEDWRLRVSEAGLKGRISLLGFTDRIAEVLAAADLLVSPVRYEAYGLNVQEAICCGVPAMVTRSAGIAERYPTELQHLLIRDPEDVYELTTKLAQWRNAKDDWKARVKRFSEQLRGHTMEDMLREIVRVIRSQHPSRSSTGRRHGTRTPRYSHDESGSEARS